MEFVEGETVRDLLAKGRVPEKDALGIARQVASGLAHAHAHGVVHRDVKPGNIMIAPDGTAKLGDFGLARGQGPSDLTLEHASIGTPQYVAPEQMRRGSDATPRSDLFSLGATLYHMVTGRPPFHGENLGEIVQNVLACRFEPPESLAPELSRDAVYVIDRLMRGDPRERYGSADELVADLERIGRGEAVAPPEFKGDYHAFLARRRGRRNAILVACALVLAAAGAFAFYRTQSEAKRQKLAEACRVADATRADVDALATVQDLQAAILDLVKADADAASAGCADDAVSNLRARLRDVRGAKKALESAEAIMEGSGEPDFRDLDRKLSDLEPPLAGVRARIDAIRAQVREGSDDAARTRYDDRIREEFRDLETAKREAKAFASDLGARYLATDAEWALDVTRAPRVLEDLERRWKAVEDARRRFDEALAATPPHYRSAANALKDLGAEEDAALEPVSRSAYLRGLVAHLPDAKDRATLLDSAERKEWTTILTVASRLEASEPDIALAAVERFRERASELTLAEVDKKRGEVGEALKSLTQRQDTLFGYAERTCLEQIRSRLYTSARDGVARAMASGRWVPDVAAKFRELHDRAQRMTELNARFLARVKNEKKVPIKGEDFAGDRIEQAPGDDKDLFVAQSAKRAAQFRLSEFNRKRLEDILAFGPEDRLLRGWFYAAEAYRADLENPYEAKELRDVAIGDLANDPWAAEVAEQVKLTNQRCLKGEARAQQAEAELREARKAGDEVKALALAIELVESLWWTKHCEKRLADFRRQRSELEQLAGRGLFLREIGVPTEQLEYGGPEIPGLAAKPTSITLTGSRWYPYKVPEDDPDRAARLEQLALAYWNGWFRSQGKTKDEVADLVPRAMRQLLLWSGPVEVVPDAAGYRPTAAALLESPTQWWEPPERPLPLHLAFPFRTDRDWSIEFEVEWPGDPGYFVVSAGRIQAVVGYQRIPTRGGMAGVCILVGEDLDPGAHAKELGDLHWHMANATKGGKPARRPIESKEKAYLDETNFVSGVPYRMRLAREDETIRFEIWPAGRDDKRVPLTKRERADQLGKNVVLADGRKVFRFFGVPGKGLGYVLRDVKITGILPERASGEAKQ
jgi:hypothetical protein